VIENEIINIRNFKPVGLTSVAIPKDGLVRPWPPRFFV